MSKGQSGTLIGGVGADLQGVSTNSQRGEIGAGEKSPIVFILAVG